MIDIVTVKDRYKDNVVVDVDDSNGIIYLTVHAGEKEADASLNADMAREIGLALLHAAFTTEDLNVSPYEPS